MSEKRRRRVDLRIVEADAAAEPDPPDDGGGGGGGSGSGGGGDRPERPMVQIAVGWRTQAIDEAEVQLVKHDRELFQRGDAIVRVAPEQIDVGGGQHASALHIIPVGLEHMRERFTRAVDLRRFDKRAGDWIRCDCPKDFAAAYLERVGWWRAPRLRAVTTAPTLRPDGTILEKPGYDKKSAIYYDPRGVRFPAVPAAPTRADARAALDLIVGLLATLDCADDAALSVALSAIFTALLRRAMTAAPLHGISAPVAGSGKSKIVNIAAILASGHHAPVTALGQRDEETEKRLGAVLIAGDAVIALDNAERPLGGELLCQVVTEPLINVRILGRSVNLLIPNVAALYATGNNLKIAGDMVRRTLICRLDPRCERPELREFETPDPCVTALAQRPELVVAALTVVRAFFLAGCPSDHAPLGSFGDWSRWVRDPLVWLGHADPVETMELVRSDDPRLSALVAVLHQWQAAVGDARLTAREVVERAGATSSYDGAWLHGEFREALLAVAADGKELSARRLGRWLATVKGRAADGLRLDAAEMLNGVGRWQLASA